MSIRTNLTGDGAWHQIGTGPGTVQLISPDANGVSVMVEAAASIPTGIDGLVLSSAFPVHKLQLGKPYLGASRAKRKNGTHRCAARSYLAVERQMILNQIADRVSMRGRNLPPVFFPGGGAPGTGALKTVSILGRYRWGCFPRLYSSRSEGRGARARREQWRVSPSGQLCGTRPLHRTMMFRERS
ncbi:MAG: hypothetical protein QOF32_1909 [Gammaproteobacteria bacterium]|jgi:hypothetical protein|nr:hypothetical protein [Gammaproteobacteria bacterium]